MIKVMYLTCLEQIINYGIFETQVKNLLFEIKRKYHSDIELTLLSFQPILDINRKGLTFNFIKYRNEFKRLQREFLANGVSLKILPALIPRRFSYMHAAILPFFILTTFLPTLIEVNRGQYNVIHCRSYKPALLACLIKKFRKSIRVIFDMRGLFPEECIIQKGWTARSFSFKLWKIIERKLINVSDKIILVSKPFARHVHSLGAGTPKDKIKLIPTSVSLNRFNHGTNPQMLFREKNGITSKRVFLYNGGLGTWHDPELLIKVFRKIKEINPNSYFLCLTPFNKSKLENMFFSNSFDSDDFTIKSVNPEDVQSWLSIAHYGVIPLFMLNGKDEIKEKIARTMISVKATEYMACVLPIIANKHVGGVAALINKYNIGITFDPQQMDGLDSKIAYLEKNYDQLRANCLSVARKLFDIEKHAERYFEIYEELMSKNDLKGK